MSRMQSLSLALGTIIFSSIALAQNQRITVAGVESAPNPVRADRQSYVSFDCNDKNRYSVSITNQNLSLVSVPQSGRCNPNSISLVGEFKQNGKTFLVRGQLSSSVSASKPNVSTWSGALVTLPESPIFASVVITDLAVPVRAQNQTSKSDTIGSAPSGLSSAVATETAVPDGDGTGPALRCQDNKCVPGGSGPYCDKPGECESKGHCRADGKCVPLSEGGDGPGCHTDSSCDYTKTCLDGVCRLGGNGVYCVGDMDCQRKRCNTAGACMLGGIGIECEDDGECSKKTCITTKCQWGLVEHGPCSSDPDCAEEKRCNAQAQCVPNEYPKSQHRCGSDADCETTSCFKGKCIPGSTDGILCSSDAVCASTKTCFNGVCKAGNLGGTARCQSSAECSHLYCENGTCVEKDWPGVSNCSEEGKPCPKGTPKGAVTATSDVMGRLSETALKPKAPIDPSLVTTKIALAHPSFSTGSDKAPVTMAIFQDYDCGQCKRFMKDNWDYLKKEFVDKGTLKIKFFEFPLIRNKEVLRHYGALCAGGQKVYEGYMTQLYSGESFKIEELEGKVVKVAELNLLDWKRCMSNESALEAFIDEHRALGRDLGVEGTPTIFINGVSVPNFKDEIRKHVSDQLKAAALSVK